MADKTNEYMSEVLSLVFDVEIPVGMKMEQAFDKVWVSMGEAPVELRKNVKGAILRRTIKVHTDGMKEAFVQIALSRMQRISRQKLNDRRREELLAEANRRHKMEVKRIRFLYPKSATSVNDEVYEEPDSATQITGKKFWLSAEWRQLRYEALELHGNRCQCCGRRPPIVSLQVDHIKSRSLYPELSLDLNNLQILCEDCNQGKGHLHATDWRAAE